MGCDKYDILVLVEIYNSEHFGATSGITLSISFSDFKFIKALVLNCLFIIGSPQYIGIVLASNASIIFSVVYPG